MNEFEVVQLFIEEIESVVSVPVRMSNHDEDHEPEMVLIDSLDINRKLRSTNPYSGVIRDSNGTVTAQQLSFYYEARLDLTVQSEDEVEAYEIRQSIKDHFHQYERNKSDLHEDLVLFEVGDGGKRTTEFDPTVFRLFKQVQAFHFEYVEFREIGPGDLISGFENDIEF